MTPAPAPGKKVIRRTIDAAPDGTRPKRKKGINSRRKGAEVEVAAAKFLTSLGFVASRMGRNGYSAADLDCSQCPVLSRVHLEVKGDRSIGVGTLALSDALEQARTHTPGYENWQQPQPPYAVLWCEHRKGWRLSWCAGGIELTTARDKFIRTALLALGKAS